MVQTLILRAKHLILDPQEHIENGAVAVCGSKIACVGTHSYVRRHVSGATRDLGDTVILPGLINAHTHLELTDLCGKIEKTDHFLDWLKQVGRFVVAWKLEDGLFPRRGRFCQSAKNGIAKSVAAGTTTAADISNSGATFHLLRYGPLRSVVFQETIDLRARNIRRKVGRIRRRLRRIPNTPLLTRGIAPHAPYSASLEMYRRSALLATELNMPLATHAHETREEIEAFEQDAGEFRHIMDYFIRSRFAQRPRCRPIAALDGLGVITSRTLLAHCNYLDRSDIAILNDRRPSVVFCPRSHAYFGHDRHPFRDLLDRGINVALGTDSLASCDSLSMLDEMRFLVTSRKDVSPSEVLAMVTTNGARALGLSRKIGRLTRGAEADITVVAIPEPCASPYEAILAPTVANRLTMIRGRLAYHAPDRA
ncbi:MAG: amidohydrolase family protein [Planctomycetes bacterium]|nr:amidohydrolase family protein [Planctomycetota bacterium]